MTFILASSSPRRAELLGSLGIPFTILKPHIDEQRQEAESALDYVRRLSNEKAEAVALQYAAQPGLQTATILAADTVVILAADTLGIIDDGDVLEKPANSDEARAMLTRLRGRGHVVCTAVTLLRVAQDQEPWRYTELARTDVYMRDYSDAEIDAYIASGDPFDKAGGYAIQNEQFHPVARIVGCYSNVVGLPTCVVLRALSRAGMLPVQGDAACDDPRCNSHG